MSNYIEESLRIVDRILSEYDDDKFFEEYLRHEVEDCVLAKTFVESFFQPVFTVSKYTDLFRAVTIEPFKIEHINVNNLDKYNICADSDVRFGLTDDGKYSEAA